MIEQFLYEKCSASAPLGIALSGGADSRYLLEKLLDFQGTLFSKLHVLHVDHRLREESIIESKELEKLCGTLNLPFHLKVLDKPVGNIEAFCREERYKFFGQIAKDESLQAICTGHHRDDQVETILKKLLESGRLDCARGMRCCTEIYGVTIWRPLLEVPKSEIVTYLKSCGIQWFEDESNLSPTLLRGRMRTKLVPFLKEQLGKEFERPLLRLNSEIEEYSEWMERYSIKYVENPYKGVYKILGLFEDAFALRALIRQICKNEKFTLSRKIEEDCLNALQKNSANKHFKNLIVDRRWLFFTVPNFGKWSFNEVDEAQVSFWKEVYLGRVVVPVPFNIYAIKNMQDIDDKSFVSKLKRRLSDKKVPQFLWEKWPVCVTKEGAFCEPLTKVGLEGKVQHFYELQR